jgi:hypothetical protein
LRFFRLLDEVGPEGALRRLHLAPVPIAGTGGLTSTCMVPVAMGPEEVAEQERIASSLIGHCLTGVAYFSLNVESWKPIWNGPAGDSVDFGVDLDFDGHPLSVGWISPTVDNEGLKVAHDSLLGWRNLDANRVDVGESSRWSPALGSGLSAVHLEWRQWSPSSSTSYLVGVHLSFADEQKFTLALAEIADGKIIRSATNVAVIFDDVTVP